MERNTSDDIAEDIVIMSSSALQGCWEGLRMTMDTLRFDGDVGETEKRNLFPEHLCFSDGEQCVQDYLIY